MIHAIRFDYQGNIPGENKVLDYQGNNLLKRSDQDGENLSCFSIGK
jgi:hypothetical protein